MLLFIGGNDDTLGIEVILFFSGEMVRGEVDWKVALGIFKDSNGLEW